MRITAYKSVEPWHPKKGAGVNIKGEREEGHDIGDADWLNAVFHLENGPFEKQLREHLDKYGLHFPSFLIFEDGRLSGNRVEDDGGEAVKPTAEDKYLENGENLWLANYDLYLELYTTIKPSTKDLTHLFPNLTLY